MSGHDEPPFDREHMEAKGTPQPVSGPLDGPDEPKPYCRYRIVDCNGDAELCGEPATEWDSDEEDWCCADHLPCPECGCLGEHAIGCRARGRRYA